MRLSEEIFSAEKEKHAPQARESEPLDRDRYL